MNFASPQDASEMRLLVCGDRNWDDPWIVARVLDGIYGQYRPNFALIEGCAPGADRAAEGVGGWVRERRGGSP
ncbi:MAG TPA: SLOG family protein [Acidimicrobiales bacterium]|jgi:hypothetical protein